MMMLPHRASLARAREQLTMLATAEREYLSSYPYRLAHEHDARAGRYLVRVQVIRPLPSGIAQLASDVFRTLRRALDELVTALAGPPTSFPIHESLALFAQRARKPIARMSDNAQATLEALQPYHAIGGFRNGPLWVLQQLALADAPRLAAGSVREGGTMGINTQRDVSLVGVPTITTGPFVDGAIIASAATRIVGRDPKLDMFLRVEFALAFASGDPARGREVVPLLREECDHVEHAIFAPLEPEIATPPELLP